MEFQVEAKVINLVRAPKSPLGKPLPKVLTRDAATPSVATETAKKRNSESL